ncbi:hypothetical protein ABBQ38_013285 [Trebouxia sp. C0009 RCD-2024]
MTKKHTTRLDVSNARPPRKMQPKQAPGDIWNISDLEDRTGMKRKAKGPDAQRQQQGVELLSTSPANTERQKGQITQQAAQGPSCKQPMAQYAFNPNARSFVPSKTFQRVNVQTLKSDSSFRARNTCSIASQAASPGGCTAALQPASPRIAAEMATPTSQKSSSTQEAPARPTPIQPAAVGTASEAGTPTISDSTTPGSESHSAQDSMANCAQDSRPTDAGVRTDEETSCTGHEAGQDEPQLDSKVRREQELHTDILDLIEELTELIHHGKHTEEQHHINKTSVQIAALACKVKEAPDVYLHGQAATRCVAKTEAGGPSQATQASAVDTLPCDLYLSEAC